MSFSLIPKEMNSHIMDFIFIQPEIITSKEIKSYARKILDISLSNKEFNQICSGKLATLKKITVLVDKYNNYNEDYEKLIDIEFDPKGNPQLIDALLTGFGSAFIRSSFGYYNSGIEKDIKEIVELTPQSMNCIIGSIRSVNELTPLAAACINVKIPLHIIEFLLQQGADSNATVQLDGYPIRIIGMLEGNLDVKRFAAIKELFGKYGAV